MQATQDYIEVAGIKGSRFTKKVGIPDTLRVMEDGEKFKKGHHIFRVMTAKDGDKRVIWDSRDLAQINDAKAMFDQLVSEGLVPYKVGLDGKSTSEVMDEFDPAAEEVIFLPIQMVVGG